jgi:hypothetical protein
MKRALIVVAGFFFATSVALAYQVTGTVVEVTDTKIVVDKDGEKFEMIRDKSTKLTGDVKKGSKVTAQYKMTATGVEAKADKKADKKEEKKK